MRYSIYPKLIFRALVKIILLLVGAHLFGVIIKYGTGHENLRGLIPLFHLNAENNIPTFYSTLSLFAAGLLLLYIGNIHRKLKHAYGKWFGLGFIFLFLTLDEMNSIHETLSVPVRSTIDISASQGLLYYAWVIPYGIAFIVFVLIYAKFLYLLEKRFSKLFILAGFLFVSGALGFELLEGWADSRGLMYLTDIFIILEEFLEMLGIAILIYTLVLYITTYFGDTKFIVQEEKPTTSLSWDGN